MKRSEYDKQRSVQAKKARAEYLEFVVTKPGRKLDDTFRCIDYIVTRMGIDSVVTDQMGGIILAHMMSFSRGEYRRGRREERADVTSAFASPDTPNALGPMCEFIERGKHVGMAGREPEDRDGV